MATVSGPKFEKICAVAREEAKKRVVPSWVMLQAALHHARKEARDHVAAALLVAHLEGRRHPDEGPFWAGKKQSFKAAGDLAGNLVRQSGAMAAALQLLVALDRYGGTEEEWGRAWQLAEDAVAPLGETTVWRLYHPEQRAFDDSEESDD